MSANNMDIKRVRRLLRETARIAEHASLTGSLEKGSRLAIRQYNAIREHLQDEDVIPHDLFPELDEDDSSFDELGVAAKLLDGYLDDDEGAGSTENGSGSGGGGNGGKHKRVEIKFGGGGSVGDFGDLRNLGEIIRSHMPEILREHMSCPPSPPTPPSPPSPASPPSPPSAPAPPESTARPDVSDAMRDLIDQLRNEDLTESERSEIASEIVRLAQAP